MSVETWISELIIDLINTVILYGAVYLFRLKKQASAGYQAISDAAEVQEFTREDIQKLDLQDILSRATQKWDGVSQLPAQPKIVDAPTIPVTESLTEELQDIPKPPEVNSVNIETPLKDDDALQP